MSERKLQVWVGLFTVLVLASLFFIAIKGSNLNVFQSSDGYKLNVYFGEIGGLKKSAPVTMAGVEIGRVASITLDPSTFQAKVVLNIYERYDQLPLDSSASILTAGILGEKYIGITPGGDTESLLNGDTIEISQSALVLENLISTFLNK